MSKITNGAELVRRLKASGTGLSKLEAARRHLTAVHLRDGRVASADEVIAALADADVGEGTLLKARRLRDTGEDGPAPDGPGVPIEDRLAANPDAGPSPLIRPAGLDPLGPVGPGTEPGGPTGLTTPAGGRPDDPYAAAESLANNPQPHLPVPLNSQATTTGAVPVPADGLEALTVKELRDIAADKGVVIVGEPRKAEIIATIRARK